MPPQSTIIIFDPHSLIAMDSLVLSDSESSIYCKSQDNLFSILYEQGNSIRVIIYCSEFTLSDYVIIQSIKKLYVVPDFILLTQDYGIDIFTEIAKLGIYSIHNISIHPAILDLDIRDILSEDITFYSLLMKRLNHVLDLDLYLTYKALLKKYDYQPSIYDTNLNPHSSTIPNNNDSPLPLLLVIEDDILLNQNLCHWLHHYNIQSCSAFTAQEGLSLCHTQSFDLIILDLSLPDNDNHHLIQHLRSLRLDTPIILLTAYKDYETLLFCMKEGAFEYITKPFDPNILIYKIKQALSFSKIRFLSLSDTALT